jgi:hypothetical protein
MRQLYPEEAGRGIARKGPVNKGSGVLQTSSAGPPQGLSRATLPALPYLTACNYCCSTKSGAFYLRPCQKREEHSRARLVLCACRGTRLGSRIHRAHSSWRIPATTTVNFARVLALLHGRLHAVVVTPRKGELRVISLRKANRKEEKLYEQHSKT